MKKLLSLLVTLLLLVLPVLGVAGEVTVEDYALVEDGVAMTNDLMVEYGSEYLAKDEVALYLWAFGELPVNYLTKNEAYAIGWKSNGRTLWECGEGLSIGGDIFGNREGILPDGIMENGDTRVWYEADVNYAGGNRNAERLLFSTDGLIYFTDDHYETASILYEGWYTEGYLYGYEAEAGGLAA